MPPLLEPPTRVTAEEGTTDITTEELVVEAEDIIFRVATEEVVEAIAEAAEEEDRRDRRRHCIFKIS